MNKNVILILSLITVYFFDIGNPDALRQGTEGFYLQISKEMRDAGNLITPIIYGEHHWSKPPLHFLFPRILSFFSNDYLFVARLSISLLSIFLISLISFWYEKELKRNWYEAFIFLVTPVYFFKYSRIFMMEMPLSLLTTLGALYYLSFLNKGNKSDLIIGTLFTGLSVLIKGPVSLFLIGPGCFIYTLYYRKSFSRFFIYFTLASLIGSIWFIISYLEHGFEFFNYFFLRENLGKFQSKSYPITSIIQGLFIFSIPVIFYTPRIIKTFKKEILTNRYTSFLLINFVFLYFIWFIPKQRSHHYAVPAIPTLLLFLSFYFFQLKKSVQETLINRTNKVLTALIIFISLVTLYGYSIGIVSLDKSTYLLGVFFIVTLWFSKKFFKTRIFKLMKPLLFMALLWNFVAPLFYLPMLPSSVKKKLENRNDQVLNIRFRKPFFIEQQVNMRTRILNNSENDYSNIQKGELLLAPSKEIENRLKLDFKHISTWRTWKRGAKVPLVRRALSTGRTDLIQQQYKLIEID